MKKIFLLCCMVMISSMLIKKTEANAASADLSCTPVGVATTYQRIHIRCAESVGGIYFFAYDARKDPAGAARYMSIATSAIIAGRNISLQYDPEDLSGEKNFGCNNKDCRPLLGIEIIGGGVN